MNILKIFFTSLTSAFALLFLNRWWNDEVESCPNCNKNEKKFFFAKRRFGKKISIHQCENCGLLFQSPRLNQKGLEIFYTKFFRTNQSLIHQIKMFERGERRGKKIFDTLSKYTNLDYKDVLEVGCGYGGILNYFKSQGSIVKGFDLDDNALKYGQSMGLDIQAGEIDQFLNTKKKFDVIILSHVLEHVSRPKEFIDKLVRLHKPNGFLFVLVPGIENQKVISSNYAIQPGHLLYFSEDTLDQVLSKNFSKVFSNNQIEAIYRSNNSN